MKFEFFWQVFWVQSTHTRQRWRMRKKNCQIKRMFFFFILLISVVTSSVAIGFQFRVRLSYTLYTHLFLYTSVSAFRVMPAMAFLVNRHPTHLDSYQIHALSESTRNEKLNCFFPHFQEEWSLSSRKWYSGIFRWISDWMVLDRRSSVWTVGCGCLSV